MNKCKCGYQPQKEDSYCRYCGLELPEGQVFECECGEEVALEDNYCFACGTKFEGLEEDGSDKDTSEEGIDEVDEKELEASNPDLISNRQK